MTIALDEHYHSLELRYPPRRDPDYERLVVPQDNAHEPVHRWFHMKEAYSPQLLARVIKDLGLSDRQRLKVHDPFLGSGTTLVSGVLAPDGPVISGSGSEVNPFLRLLSATKLAAIVASSAVRERIASDLREAMKNLVSACLSKRTPSPAPQLAAFQEARFFKEDHLADLLRMRDYLTAMRPSLLRDLVAVVLASALEPCSQLRRDGRALRYVANRIPQEPLDYVAGKMTEVADDLLRAEARGNAKVMHGSALRRASWPRCNQGVDLVCFSPPYPNNIDYTEVYKLEAWFLGLVSDHQVFRDERDSTIRSHPSIVFSPRTWGNVPLPVRHASAELAAPLRRAVPLDRYQRQRERVIQGYLDDMAVVLWRCYNSLKAGGHAVYIVGNSRHGTAANGTYTIASDVLIAALAEEVGFEVQQIKAARSLHRRGRHHHMRESVVLLRKRIE